MAWVEKRPGGYLVRWRDGEGRKKQRLYREEPEARVFASSLSNRSRGPKPADHAVLLSEYMTTTLRAAEGLRESTRYNYQAMANKHILPALGTEYMHEVTSAELRELLSEMRGSGYASSYRAIARDVLSRTFRLAVVEGLIPRNPLDAVPVLRQEPRGEVQPLDVQEVEALADSILPRYRAAVLVMAYAGLRVGEVGGLTIRNVNLLARELRVVSAVARAGGRLIVAAPKTSAGRRIVPLPLFLATEMREHVERFGLAPDGRVFHTPFVNQHDDQFGLLHAGSIHKPFKLARVQAGLGDVHPHTLRHTYAAFLIREGAHPKVMQTLMGHTSIKVTMDLYGHLLPGLGQELADRLDDRRGEAALRLAAPGEAGRTPAHRV